MGYQSELSKCGGGSFRLQFKTGLVLSDPDLDLSKGTQHMTGFTVRDFFFSFFRICFDGNFSMACSFCLCICF